MTKRNIHVSQAVSSQQQQHLTNRGNEGLMKRGNKWQCEDDKKHMIEVNQGELLGASHTPNPKCYVTVLQKQKT